MMPNSNLIIKLTTLDSFYIAIEFIISFLNKELKEIDIINKNATVYNKSLMDRYILYIMVYVLYMLISCFLWLPKIGILENILLGIVIPPIINRILDNYYFLVIIKKKEQFIKKIIAKNLSKIIGIYADIYLDKKIHIKYKELLPLLDDYKRTIEYTYSIIKTALTLILLSKVREYSPNFYYVLSKRLYTYKTGNMLHSFNTNNAKDLLVAMINSRKWDELLKPNVQKAIIELYNSNNNDTNIIDTIVTQFNYKILKLSTILLLCPLFNCWYMAPICSTIFILYRDLSTKNSVYRLLGPVISLCYGYFNSNCVTACILSELSYNIIVNNITENIYKSAIKKVKNNIKILCHYNKNDNTFFVITAIYMILLSVLAKSSITLIIGFHIIYNLLLNNNIDRTVIMTLMFCTTYISSFNVWHVLINSCILYGLNPIIYIIIHNVKHYINYESPIKPTESNNIITNSSYAIINDNPIDNVCDIDNMDNDKDNIFEVNKSTFYKNICVDNSLLNLSNIIIYENYMDNK